MQLIYLRRPPDSPEEESGTIDFEDSFVSITFLKGILIVSSKEQERYQLSHVHHFAVKCDARHAHARGEDQSSPM